MSLRTDVALNALHPRVLDEFRLHASANLRSDLTSSILVLNEVLLDRAHKIDTLRARLTQVEQERDTLAKGLDQVREAAAFNHARAEKAEAALDALMFEYCPEDVTQEQIQRYSDAQRPVRGAKE